MLFLLLVSCTVSATSLYLKFAWCIKLISDDRCCFFQILLFMKLGATKARRKEPVIINCLVYLLLIMPLLHIRRGSFFSSLVKFLKSLAVDDSSSSFVTLLCYLCSDQVGDSDLASKYNLPDDEEVTNPIDYTSSDYHVTRNHLQEPFSLLSIENNDDSKEFAHDAYMGKMQVCFSSFLSIFYMLY